MTLSPEQAKKRIHQLTEEINHHNFLYYSEAQPVISDYEFDQLLEELISLENQILSLHNPIHPHKE